MFRVTAEVKHNSTNAVVCRVQGEWNGVLEFSYTSGETKVVDVTKLPVTRKRVRPIEKQAPTESRWAGFWREASMLAMSVVQRGELVLQAAVAARDGGAAAEGHR